VLPQALWRNGRRALLVVGGEGVCVHLALQAGEGVAGEALRMQRVAGGAEVDAAMLQRQALRGVGDGGQVEMRPGAGPRVAGRKAAREQLPREVLRMQPMLHQHDGAGGGVVQGGEGGGAEPVRHGAAGARGTGGLDLERVVNQQDVPAAPREATAHGSG
jgi:hypothetical protein